MILVAGALACSLAQAAPDSTLEIRLCPSDRLYAYPLDARAKIESLLLHTILIVNRSDQPVDVGAVHIDLLNHNKTIDRRTLPRDETADWGRSSGTLAQYAAVMPFDFCNMVGSSLHLGHSKLGRREALAVVLEPFAFQGQRDFVRVYAEASSQSGRITAERMLPIREEFTKTRFAFPLKGTWWIADGPGFYGSHRTHVPEEFAWDVEKLGADGHLYGAKGLRFTDYYGYGAAVMAAADGVVVKLANNLPEVAAAMQQTGESTKSYAARHLSEEQRLFGLAPERAAGNFVLLDHGNGEYSLYAHMQRGSVPVRVGQRMKTGDVLGKLGSSGNSTDPHLHFQVCNKPAVLMCEGIPVEFSNLSILEAEGQRPLQIGDIVTTK